MEFSGTPYRVRDFFGVLLKAIVMSIRLKCFKNASTPSLNICDYLFDVFLRYYLIVIQYANVNVVVVGVNSAF